MFTDHATQTEELLTTDQVAKLLRKSKRTIEAWRYRLSNPLPFVRIGHPKYLRSDVEKLLNPHIKSKSEMTQALMTVANVLCQNQGEVFPLNFAAISEAVGANPRLMPLARECQSALLVLVNKSAASQLLRAAIADSGDACSAERCLRDQLAAVNASIAAFDEHLAAEKSRFMARAEASSPFLVAVAKLETSLVQERDHIRNRVSGFESNKALKVREGQKGGLSIAEMTLLGRFDPNAEPTVKTLQIRLAEIERQLAQIAAFDADPMKLPIHLAGLDVPGFVISKPELAINGPCKT